MIAKKVAQALGFRKVCPVKGCKEASEKRGFTGGKVPVCVNCGKCVSHCKHESFDKATSQEDINEKKQERAEEDYGE